MNKLNVLLSQNPQAKSYFLSLDEQEQGLLIQSSDSVATLADMKQVLHRCNTNNKETGNQFNARCCF